ncbi:hypothetical protein [Streptomyces sp. NBC_00237]|nr:hypothetical protein [Streptomyces sp. NBC_00237]
MRTNQEMPDLSARHGGPVARSGAADALPQGIEAILAFVQADRP